jgi:hypothetical protein
MSDQKQQQHAEIEQFKALMEMPIRDRLEALARPLTDRGWATGSITSVTSSNGCLSTWLVGDGRCPVRVRVVVRSRVPTEGDCICFDCEDDPLMLGEWIPNSGEDLLDWMVRMDGVARAHREATR